MSQRAFIINQNATVEREEKRTLDKNDKQLKVIKLKKKYGKKVALNGITFSLEKKINFGLIGPNGAGKSTTFNIILNKIRKSSGILELKDTNKDQSFLKNFLQPSVFEQHNFGVSFQGDALWEEMNVKDNLKFYADLNYINKACLDNLVKFFEFDYYIKKRVDELSSGNKRKLCIIISLLTNPSIILYDEATCGVDLMIRMKLKLIFQYLKQKNEAIGIFTTHFLKDVEVFCDKLGLIENGRFLCVDFIESIKKHLGGYILRFYEPNSSMNCIIQQELDKLGTVKQQKTVQVSNKKIDQYFIYGNQNLLELFNVLEDFLEHKYCSHFTINQLSIEDIYLNLLEKEELQFIQ